MLVWLNRRPSGPDPRTGTRSGQNSSISEERTWSPLGGDPWHHPPIPVHLREVNGAGDKKDRRDLGRHMRKEDNIASTVVCLRCYNKVPYTGRIMTHRNVLSTFHKLGSPRPRCQQTLGVVQAFFSGSQTVDSGYVLTLQKHLVSSPR